MAKPIKETPILKGKDAKRFLEEMARSSEKKVNPATLAKMKKNFASLNAIAKF